MERVKNLTNADFGDIKKGHRYCAYSWTTLWVKVIPTKDGYKLGFRNAYENENGNLRFEVCEIKFDEEGTPYIEAGTGESTFTEEYCLSKITRTLSSSKIVQDIGFDVGFSVWYYGDGRADADHSIFDLSSYIGPFFDGVYRTADLNEAGLRLIYQWISDPKHKELLDERIKQPSVEEIESWKDDVRKILEESLDGKRHPIDVEKAIFRCRELIERPLLPRPIKLNLREYEVELQQNSSQPE